MKLPDVLTVSNPKTKNNAIRHNFPGKALANACRLDADGSIPARGHLPALRELAASLGVLDKALAVDFCPFATPACREACLNWAGRGGLGDAVAIARGKRSISMLLDPVADARATLFSIAWHHRRAAVEGRRLACRLAGTDEGVHWHRLRVPVSVADAQLLSHRFGLTVAPTDGATLGEILRDSVTLYDYHKGPLSYLQANRDAGWDVTASFRTDAPDAVAHALSVAPAFRLAVPVAIRKGDPIPRTLTLSQGDQSLALPCVDGDATDDRFRDPDRLTAVVLSAKRSRGANPLIARPFFLNGPEPGKTESVTTLNDGIARLQW
jgi:hypothetical protein|tara:strand:- start:52 stop:1020 length:969 start_codon:yes stop_codon:yes gene_type:complete